MADIQDQLQELGTKLSKIEVLITQLKAENVALKTERDELQSLLDTQKQLTADQTLPLDQEVFQSKLMQAKKLKREVEQTLRDAERRLESLRF